MIDATKLWIGAGISILLLVLFMLTVDVDRMVEAMSDADYLFLVPGVGMYLISVLFRTLRWQVLLRHLKRIDTRRLYPVVVVGYMANNLLPMRLGELVRSYYVGEREGISKASALVTILVERVLDALMLLFFISAIAVFVPLTGLAESFGDRLGISSTLLVAIFTAPFVVVFGMLLAFALFPTVAWVAVMAAIRPLPDRIERKVRSLLELFLNGLRPLRNPRTLSLLFLLSVPIWLFEAGLFFFVGFSFGLDAVYDSLGEMAVAAVLVTAIANIGSSFPAAPGGIGLFELVTRETLVLIPLASVDRAVAAGFAAVVHTSLLLPMIVLGQAFLWAEHISLRSLFRDGRAEASGSKGKIGRKQRLVPAALSVDGKESE